MIATINHRSNLHVTNNNPKFHPVVNRWSKKIPSFFSPVNDKIPICPQNRQNFSTAPRIFWTFVIFQSVSNLLMFPSFLAQQICWTFLWNLKDFSNKVSFRTLCSRNYIIHEPSFCFQTGTFFYASALRGRQNGDLNDWLKVDKSSPPKRGKMDQKGTKKRPKRDQKGTKDIWKFVSSCKAAQAAATAHMVPDAVWFLQFSTLYWSFFARHETSSDLDQNPASLVYFRSIFGPFLDHLCQLYGPCLSLPEPNQFNLCFNLKPRS